MNFHLSSLQSCFAGLIIIRLFLYSIVSLFVYLVEDQYIGKNVSRGKARQLRLPGSGFDARHKVFINAGASPSDLS